MSRRRGAPAGSTAGLDDRVAEVVEWLERTGTQETRDGMARYAIPADRAFGVPVGELRKHAKTLGRDHELALALWQTGHYEARLLAAFTDEPSRVTVEQMDRWCQDFDSWAICDTVCFHLFDRAPDAWGRVQPWAAEREEFRRRAAFAMIWSLSVHDKKAPDSRFLDVLPLFETAARDERNFVKKGIDMALRAVGKRNAALHAAALELAERLAGSDDATQRWIGKHSLRELRSAKVVERVRGRR